MKGVFRHYSTILLMFGVMISFIAFMNGADIYRQIQYSLAEVNEYQYKYAYTLSILDVTDVQELPQELQEIKGNIVLSDSLYLDAATGEAILDILKKVNQMGNTVILVTHDEKIAKKTNRLIILENSRLVSDTPINICQEEII